MTEDEFRYGFKTKTEGPMTANEADQIALAEDASATIKERLKNLLARFAGFLRLELDTFEVPTLLDMVDAQMTNMHERIKHLERRLGPTDEAVSLPIDVVEITALREDLEACAFKVGQLFTVLTQQPAPTDGQYTPGELLDHLVRSSAGMIEQMNQQARSLQLEVKHKDQLVALVNERLNAVVTKLSTALQLMSEATPVMPEQNPSPPLAQGRYPV